MQHLQLSFIINSILSLFVQFTKTFWCTTLVDFFSEIEELYQFPSETSLFFSAYLSQVTYSLVGDVERSEIKSCFDK